MNTIHVILLMIVGNIIDLTFTVLLIKETAKVWEHPEEAEVNWQKFFFKKFGLKKGAIIAEIIIIPAIIVIMYYMFNHNPLLALFFCGIQWGVAYVNFITWSTYDATIKKLGRRLDK